MSQPKLYSKAPLPFIGQKRNFLKAFRQVLGDNIPDDGDGWTIVDVFGGSGLLANNAKHYHPKAQVIYNDFDGYSERLKHINDTENLRQLVLATIIETKRGKALSKTDSQSVKRVFDAFSGYIDIQCAASWLLFSGKQVRTLEELFSHKLYHSVRISPYSAAGDYLKGIKVVNESYTKLMPKYFDRPKTLLLLDPPYLYTGQGAYKQDKYFAMVDFLYLISLTRPPYVFFSSTKSELLSYLEYLKDINSDDWQRLGGYDRFSIKAHLNSTAAYEDNMIFKFV